MSFNKLADPKEEPTLAEMTRKAIEVVSKCEEGYFLFVEGGLIDYGNHFNSPTHSLAETLQFEQAVQEALELTNPEETLIVVTSDHAHPLTISGYPGRGTPILELNQDDTDVNGVKYATLNYAVGTEQYLDEHGQRIDLTDQIGAEGRSKEIYNIIYHLWHTMFYFKIFKSVTLSSDLWQKTLALNLTN